MHYLHPLPKRSFSDKDRTALVYGYKHKYLEGILAACPFGKNNSSRFHYRAYDLFSHGFLTQFTVPGVSYVEQSTPVRKQLVISICLVWQVVVIVIYEAHS